MVSTFSKDVLTLDAQKEIDKIVLKLQESVFKRFKRKGAVLGISGGIDSSVVAALCLKAFGNDRVLALTMPEKDSDKDTMKLCQILTEHYKLKTIHENITELLRASRCYERQFEAISEVIPDINKNWKFKIVLPSVIESEKLRFFSVVAQDPYGNIVKKRLPVKAYLSVVAATNFKQRIRKMIEYYHADRLNFAVMGTPNRLEYDQGFFVKNGDGSADVKPIAHLYKSQVYQLANALGVPKEISSRSPTTDTYSMPQSQDEFYFSLAYDKMDLCLYAFNNEISRIEVAEELGLTEGQIERVFKDIEQKRKTTAYQHARPVLMEDVPQITY